MEQEEEKSIQQVDLYQEKNQPLMIDPTYEVDYSVTDAVFAEPFFVLKPRERAGFGWWNGFNGRMKVDRLIQAFKWDATILEACNYAGITINMYKYFCKVHPSFSTQKDRCKLLPGMAAKKRLAAELGDLSRPAKTAIWYLERHEPETYGKKRLFSPF